MDTKKYENENFMPEILRAVDRMGYQDMTEIQQKAIPIMLEGKDIIAKAPTGTGKTCAFGIPILERIDAQEAGPQALILSPTRELATQICTNLQQLSQFMPGVRTLAVYGGQAMDKQITALKRKPQIIVATPGRLIDHMKRRTIRLDQIKYVVLDEADRMLDMGFVKDVCYILDRTPEQRQLAMFSATISREVMDISWVYQRDPAELTVLPDADSEPKITQYSLESAGSKKIEDLIRIFREKGYHRAIVFCNTKYMTDRLYQTLVRRKFNAEALHGDIKQILRNRIMAKFKAGEIDILVATDVAARGIDVTDVDVVFNYDVPQENAHYLHRIGRTGRAKKEGTSYIFYASDERAKLNEIIRYTRSEIIPFSFENDTESASVQPKS